MVKCRWCNVEFIKQNSSQFYCSKQCSKLSRNKQNIIKVAKRRKALKLNALHYKGNKCQICSYSRLADALEFHHIEPEHKDFGISQKGHTRSWEKIKKELDKCILVCAICHRECHAGLHDISTIPMLSIELPEVVKIKKRKSIKAEKISINRPDKNILKKLLWDMPTTHIAEKYNVSDKAVQKWARKFGLNKPSRGYWSKIKFKGTRAVAGV